jgi:hypothetical protein
MASKTTVIGMNSVVITSLNRLRRHVIWSCTLIGDGASIREGSRNVGRMYFWKKRDDKL